MVGAGRLCRAWCSLLVVYLKTGQVAICLSQHYEIARSDQDHRSLHVPRSDVLLRPLALPRHPLSSFGVDHPRQTKTEDDEEEPEDEATRLNEVRAMIYDLGLTLQFHNAERGI